MSHPLDAVLEPMTLDDIIDFANQNGLRANNLFQRDDGSWQSNLCDSVCYEFGTGPTPRAALIAALKKTYDAA